MLVLAVLLFFQGNIFVGGGVNFGTDFTNTSAQFAPSLSAHAFPFGIKNIGIFSTLEWGRHNSDVEPFKVSVKNKTFVAGPTFRILRPRVQPSVRVGFMHFKENIDVTFGEKTIANGRHKKNTVFLGVGSYIKVRKNLYLDPEVSLAVSRRLPWGMTLRALWAF